MTTFYRYREHSGPFGFAPVIGAGYDSRIDALEAAARHAEYLRRNRIDAFAVFVERYSTDSRYYVEPQEVARFGVR